jgi:hypothetical protein
VPRQATPTLPRKQPRSPRDVRAWLDQQPSLGELKQAYPAEWAQVERELADVLGETDLATLEAHVASLTLPLPAELARVRSPSGHDGLLSAQIRQRMAVLVLKQLCLAAATGVSKGKVRFNLLNGMIAQRLLFRRDLERKPVSLRPFRLLWPLVWQRRLLMPLVQPKGIYCFYSRELIRELAAMIGDRSCLEIAAGDGTLARFLADQGAAIIATDDYSWEQSVRHPSTVLREDARTALRTRRPEVVICSWPPAANAFEQDVFTTDSVQLYIVINAGLEAGSGNRVAYREQTAFTFVEDPRLSRLVLPPELGSVVHVFERKT